MKDCYFLIVVSAVICTVWSEAESQDCDSNDEMLKKCLIPIQVLTDDGGFGFSMSRELDRVCPELDRGMRCIDSHTRRCMTEEERHRFHRLYHSTAQFIKKLCHPGPHQEEFLIHAPCMRQVNDDYDHCARQYQQKIGKVHAKMNDQERRPSNETSAENDSDLRTICCSFRDYLVCSQRIVMKKCGEQAAKFTEDFLNQMSFSLIQAHCESYPHGSDQCQASSASRKSPLVLLLPISLAMISLYAPRPT